MVQLDPLVRSGLLARWVLLHLLDLLNQLVRSDPLGRLGRLDLYLQNQYRPAILLALSVLSVLCRQRQDHLVVLLVLLVL